MSSQPLVAAEEREFDPTQSSLQVNYARMMSHLVQKGFQMGGVVGCLLVVPIAAYRGRGSGAALAPRAVAAIYKTALTTTALSVAMGVGRLATVEDLKGGLEDRVYRLHYNAGQVRCDQFAAVGTLAGAAAAAALLPMAASTLIGGGAAGAAVGVLAHVATAPKKEE